VDIAVDEDWLDPCCPCRQRGLAALCTSPSPLSCAGHAICVTGIVVVAFTHCQHHRGHCRPRRGLAGSLLSSPSTWAGCIVHVTVTVTVVVCRPCRLCHWHRRRRLGAGHVIVVISVCWPHPLRHRYCRHHRCEPITLWSSCAGHVVFVSRLHPLRRQYRRHCRRALAMVTTFPSLSQNLLIAEPL
jgi:hypothetical protein